MRNWLPTCAFSAAVLIIACNSTVPVLPLTEVEKAKKKLSDLNATQIQATKKLIETRNLLLSMPQDSPPTREISRQLAILNKQAGDLVAQVFAAELALDAAIKAEKIRKDKEILTADQPAAVDANATANTETNAPNSSVSDPDVPALPGVNPEPTNPE